MELFRQKKKFVTRIVELWNFNYWYGTYEEQIEEQACAVVNKRYVLYLSCFLNLLREIMKIYERGGEYFQ